MNTREFFNIVGAILIFTAVAGFSFAIGGQWGLVAQGFLFSIIIIFVSVFSKKIMALLLDTDVEHELWHFQRYFWYPRAKLEKPVPMGIILPAFFTIISLGFLKVTTFLTYEARALKVRARRKFGFYSFTELTDWHNSLIGAAGIVAVLILSIIAYFLPISPQNLNVELLAKLSVYYAFWNILPISNLDGSQIFFGSRTLWTILATITLIFTVFALLTFL